jgi:hypothetical protein
VHNSHDSRTLRLLGAPYLCGPDGCLEPGTLPVEIPSRGTASFTVTYRAIRPGHFSLRFPVYSSAPGQVEIELTITGEAIDTRASLARRSESPGGRR